MDRTSLVVIISLAFFLTFLAGWVLRWAYGRLNSVNSVNVSEIDDLANRLHEAEEARDQAMTYLQQREWELTNKLTQTEAELAAAMEGLGAARRESGEYQERLAAFESQQQASA
jgi:chromosome segregation ATPase